jgi:signal peptide peptidase SppA
MPSNMSVLDVLTSPWAIQPAKLLEIQDVYLAHTRGEKPDLAAIEARIGKPLANEQKLYSVHDGVAVLPIEGILAKRMNLFMQISGGTSTEIAASELRKAVDDPQVHSIVLAIDSPGGTVDGTQAMAAAVRAARDVKPVAVVANGMMASAAYWIGSAATPGMVFVSDGTTQVGSIGVVATHTDISGAEAQRGLKTTEITAGKYKRIASQHAPLSDEGRQTIQAAVDYQYGLFVEAVAENRGTTTDDVLERMADGRVFIGAQAVQAGLVDGIASLGQVVADLKSRRQSANSTGATMPITREQLAAEAPDLVAALQAEGAAAERERIQSVEGQLIPGHEALIASLKFDGKTSGPEAAVAVLAAERKSRGTAAANLAADAPNPVPAASVPAYTPQAKPEPEIDPTLPVEQRCKAQWESNAELHREFSSLGAYTAFVRATEKGVARIMTKQGA